MPDSLEQRAARAIWESDEEHHQSKLRVRVPAIPWVAAREYERDDCLRRARAALGVVEGDQEAVEALASELAKTDAPARVTEWHREKAAHYLRVAGRTRVSLPARWLERRTTVSDRAVEVLAEYVAGRDLAEQRPDRLRAIWLGQSEEARESFRDQVRPLVKALSSAGLALVEREDIEAVLRGHDGTSSGKARYEQALARLSGKVNHD